MTHGRLIGLAGIVMLLWALTGHGADDSARADEAVLQQFGVGSDSTSLLDFFRKRTLKEADRQRLEQFIRRLGDDAFEERQKAQRELIQIGTPALPLLRAAVKDPDLEIARRAERCVQSIESGAGSGLPAAAARTLALRQHPEATAVLLRYLPFADDAAVEDEILNALGVLNPATQKADTLLIQSLKDDAPVRRSAAAFVLGRHADAELRRQVENLLTDADARVRWRAVQGLITGKEKSAMPALVALLGDSPLEIALRAEELLQRIGGTQSPEAFLGAGAPEVRQKCQAAWEKWRRDHAGNVDLAKLADLPPVLGLTLCIEYNTNRVWEAGPDGKMRWQVTVQGPMDAQVLPGNRVLIAESNGHRVSERDVKGGVIWQKEVAGEPINCQRLPNGNTFIGLRNGVMEVNREGKEIVNHTIGGTFHAVRRLKNGAYVYITSNGVIGEVDNAGKAIRSVTLKHEGTWGDVDKLASGNYLVANYGVGFLREIDGEGKTVWEAKVPGACGLERLSNGQTLVASPQRAVVVDHAGKPLWEMKSDGFVRRAHRR